MPVRKTTLDKTHNFQYGLWIKYMEGRTSVGRDGAPSTMYCNIGSERNVVQRHGTPDEIGAMFWQSTV